MAERRVTRVGWGERVEGLHALGRISHEPPRELYLLQRRASAAVQVWQVQRE